MNRARSIRKTPHCLVLLLALAGLPSLAEPGPQPPGAVGFDSDRQVWLFDTDGDSFPDLTEEIGGTDPFDKESNPLKPLLVAAAETQGPVDGGKVGFQQATCRTNFFIPFNTQSSLQRLCITRLQGPANLTNAVNSCRARYSRLCTYEDLAHVYFTSDEDYAYNPGGRWLGDWTLDNNVNCGNALIDNNNDPDIWDFEGTCSKFDSRYFWCCHDRT